MSAQTELPPPPAKTEDRRDGEREHAFAILAAVHAYGKAFAPINKVSVSQPLCDDLVAHYLRTLSAEDLALFDMIAANATATAAPIVARVAAGMFTPEQARAVVNACFPGFDAEGSPDETA